MVRRAALADPEAEIELVPWAELRRRMDYRHNEHVTIVGPTQRGKTTLAMDILEMRRNVVLIGTKPKDANFAHLARGYKRTLIVPHVAVARRVLVWPAMRGIDDIGQQRVIIARALDQVFEDGNRALLADEVHYLAEFLHLAPRLKLFWTQGASNGLSLVAGFQRPAWVPRDAYSSATHLYFFGNQDDTDASAIGGLGGLNSRVIREAVKWLAGDPRRLRQFVYVNTRTGEVLRSELTNVRTPKG